MSRKSSRPSELPGLRTPHQPFIRAVRGTRCPRGLNVTGFLSVRRAERLLGSPRALRLVPRRLVPPDIPIWSHVDPVSGWQIRMPRVLRAFPNTVVGEVPITGLILGHLDLAQEHAVFPVGARPPQRIFRAERLLRAASE